MVVLIYYSDTPEKPKLSKLTIWISFCHKLLHKNVFLMDYTFQSVSAVPVTTSYYTESIQDAVTDRSEYAASS